MSLFTRIRKQTALYFKKDLAADEFGKYGFSDPVEISCRWEDVLTEINNSAGEVFMSKATVFVDRDMKTGDYLMLADLGCSIFPEPEKNETAFPIVKRENIPNFKATEILKLAYL